MGALPQRLHLPRSHRALHTRPPQSAAPTAAGYPSAVSNVKRARACVGGGVAGRVLALATLGLVYMHKSSSSFWLFANP